MKKIARDFLVEMDKLKKVDELVTTRNSDGSLFLANSDVTNIRARKNTIEYLYNPVYDEIFKKRGDLDREFIPYGSTLSCQIALIQQRIDKLTEADCAEILGGLKANIEGIMSSTPNKEVMSENVSCMQRQAANSGMRAALQVHSFEDKWFFTFLAKMVQSIKEALGFRTSSEKLLDDSVDEINKSSLSP